MSSPLYDETPILTELNDLLDTVAFSLETAEMAVAPAGHPSLAAGSLARQVRSRTSEERETGQAAIEALVVARTAFVELAEAFDRDDLVAVGYALGFWTTFEWCWDRLFTETAHGTGAETLYRELKEARRRTEDLRSRLRGATTPKTWVH